MILHPRSTLAFLVLLGLVPPIFTRADDAPDAVAGVEFFEAKIRPVLVERCLKCHASEGPKAAKGGLRLDDSASIRRGGDTGPMLGDDEPGKIDADASLLLEALSHEGGIAAMPPDAKLPEKILADFRQWVERGAPMPEFAAAASDTEKTPAKAGIDFAIGRQFWSFVAAAERPVPTIADPSWARTRIDPFVRARLEKQGIASSPEADRRTLIRRLSFDLTGLPPSNDEVTSFVADESPEAYDHLVDRLLASPRYGERWGRLWLDVARYAEDNPTSEATNKPPRNPHVYRDWVIKAINDDLPYDEFVRRQLAADLEPGLPPNEVAATGFLGLSPIYHKEPKLSAEVIGTIVADEWDERVDTVTRGILGLTVACARCHDHKFDPIGTADYYALAGVMASTDLVDRALEPVDDATAEGLAGNRRYLTDLEQRLGYAKEQKGVVEKAKGDVAKAQESVSFYEAKVKEAKRRERFDGSTAPGIRDAGLWVDGSDPSWTTLDFRPGGGRDLPIFVRGSITNHGPITPRRFLEVLSPNEPKPFEGAGSGRLELANAMVAGPGKSLAARVIVNRVWGWHFGRGLVSTASNFGKLGDPPTHPDLLDDLAARFIASGWSLKWLHREIVRSSTYRQASQGPEAITSQTDDPENRWLGRMTRRRLDVESWRDALLCVDGSIDLSEVGGRSGNLDRGRFQRRTVYARISRQRLSDVLKVFDFPDPNRHGEARDQTTTPIQQLYFLNSPFLQERAETLAKQLPDGSVATPEDRVRSLYRSVLQRDPTSPEAERATHFVDLEGGVDQPEAWAVLAQSLLISNEFLFID